MENQSPRAFESAGAGIVHCYERSGPTKNRPVIQATPAMAKRLRFLLWAESMRGAAQ